MKGAEKQGEYLCKRGIFFDPGDITDCSCTDRNDPARGITSVIIVWKGELCEFLQTGVKMRSITQMQRRTFNKKRNTSCYLLKWKRGVELLLSGRVCAQVVQDPGFNVHQQNQSENVENWCVCVLICKSDARKKDKEIC
jgi:hypothetical protein